MQGRFDNAKQLSAPSMHLDVIGTRQQRIETNCISASRLCNAEMHVILLSEHVSYSENSVAPEGKIILISVSK